MPSFCFARCFRGSELSFGISRDESVWLAETGRVVSDLFAIFDG